MLEEYIKINPKYVHKKTYYKRNENNLAVKRSSSSDKNINLDMSSNKKRRLRKNASHISDDENDKDLFEEWAS